MQYRHRHYRPGSAMVLAIVSVMLLFIIGMSFIVSTKTEKDVTDAIDSRAVLDDAVKTVIEDIRTVLVQDLVGTDDLLLNNDTDDEPYDYPYSNVPAVWGGSAPTLGTTDDAWLASLEPRENTSGGYYYWPHITDLYGSLDPISYGPFSLQLSGLFPTAANFYDPIDRNDPTQFDGSAASDYYRTNFYNTWTIAHIISDDQGTETIQQDTAWDDNSIIVSWGARADADGDGVSDSRWALVPNLSGPQGENLYTAVRIIDNCAMVNLNTAYGVPDATTNWDGSAIAAADWDGSRLTDININTDDTANIFGINAISDSGALRDFQMARCESDDDNADTYPDVSLDPITYNDDVAMQILNTNDHEAATFGISEELELRNRYFLTSPVLTRLGGFNYDYTTGGYTHLLWQTTFDPCTGGVGKIYPYDPCTGDLNAWYDKVTCDWNPTTPDVGYYNRRKISTTYSFDRVICPWKGDWTGASACSDTDTMPIALATEWNNRTGWGNFATGGVLNNYNPININKDFTVGVLNDNLQELAAAIWLGLGTGATLNGLTNPPFAGLSADLSWTPADVRERLACQLAVNIVDFIDIDTDEPTVLTVGSDEYVGCEEDAPRLYISQIAIAQYDDNILTNPSAGEETHYAIQFYNPGPNATDLGNWTLTIGSGFSSVLPSGSLSAGSTVVLANDTTNFAGATAWTGLTFSAADTFELQWTGGGTPNYSIDYVVTSGTFNLATSNNTWQVFSTGRGSATFPRYSTTAIDLPVWTNTMAWPGISTLPAFTATSLGGTIPLEFTVKNAQLTNLGELSRVLTIGTMKVGGTVVTMPEMLEKLDTAGLLIYNVAAHIDWPANDGTDDAYADLSRFLTVFAPFDDGLDNDGTDLVTENPGGDGFDNDLDTVIDNVEEDAPGYYETAIPGRININTAPWFVIAQLPWIQDITIANNDPEKFKLARAITAYRDLVDLSALFAPATAPDYTDRIAATGIAGLSTAPGFTSIGELTNVTNTLVGPGDEYYDIRRYGKNAALNTSSANTAPFYNTTTDTVDNDIYERDVIFHRISNLATVRSDVFTAYIAVRLGEQGPIKRVIAIFDRSNVYSASDSPRIIALHEVPMPQ